MAAPSSSSEIASEGPVLNLLNKRLRALKKKLNRVNQMEDALSQGKVLNKEQEETLRTKPSLLAGIDELEKLRQPLSQALAQEIELAFKNVNRNPDIVDTEIQSEETAAEPENKAGDVGDSLPAVSDLLNLLYFASVFDVKTMMRVHENMLTRTHERNCCLTYDYVTDDTAAGEPLKELDLDLIAMLGGLLISRPVDSSLSHKHALQKCVECAQLWLAKADQPIEPNSTITYAGLREKLNKIVASDYFTTTPEIKAPEEVAAAAGNYTSFPVPVHESIISPVSSIVPVEGTSAEHQKEEEQSPDVPHSNENYDDITGPVEELHQEVPEVENFSEGTPQTEQGMGIPNEEFSQNSRDTDSKDQHFSRKPNQNYRGGNRRGYGNSRGGRGGNRGGGGGYQNGHSQYYDQQQTGGGYYPRNSYNYRGRGGRGMGGGSGNNYNYHSSVGHAQVTS